MESLAKRIFSNIEEMSEHQVRVLLETAQGRGDSDIVNALDEELVRRGAVIEEMSEPQVRELLEAAQERKEFDMVDALEAELERRGVMLD